MTIEEKIKQLNVHWIQISPIDGVPEIFLDNHMLQTFRACEASFYESFIRGYGSTGSVWFLSLGSAVHKMIELYYLNRRKPGFDVNYWAVEIGFKVWHSLAMEQFSERKEYQLLGGLHGFVGLLLQYATHFNHDNERFRVIGAELFFGSHREVPIQEDATIYPWAPFRFYLSGKIDLLIDDGECICPMDHKTSKDFMGKNPMISYELQEGMTGYIYAARKLLKNYKELYSDLGRKETNKIWMNFLQIKATKGDNLGDRFLRAPLYKTEQQLEDYRLRQIRTASKIFNLVVNEGATPDYNTMMCNNWMHGQCGFQPIHRRDSNSHLVILNSTFVKKEIWNPEKPTQEDEKIGEMVP